MSQTDHKNTPAHRLTPETKKSIALDVLSGMGVTQTAKKNAVCRNSVYIQKNKAEAAIESAFVDNFDINRKLLFSGLHPPDLSGGAWPRVDLQSQLSRYHAIPPRCF